MKDRRNKIRTIRFFVFKFSHISAAIDSDTSKESIVSPSAVRGRIDRLLELVCFEAKF